MLKRVYTSRYSNPSLITHPASKVRMTRGHPRWKLPYHLAGTEMELAPSQAEFALPDLKALQEAYRARLDLSHFAAIWARLDAIATSRGTDELVLLCYEDIRKPGVGCHRETTRQWFLDNGAHCEELHDSSTPAPTKPKRNIGRPRLGYSDQQGVLKLFESSSNPGLFHAVIMEDLDADVQPVRCTCLGFLSHKRCWHIDDVNATLRGLAG